MKNLILFFCLYFVIPTILLAQDNCFENCWENLEKSWQNPNQEQGETNYIHHPVLEALKGCKAPNFKVETISGDTIEREMLTGKVVVLNFWFVKCQPCINELPGFKTLVEEFNDQEVVFIAFGRDKKSEINKFLQKYDFPFQIIPDGQAMAELYCTLSGFPMTMILDKEGILRHISTGGPAEPNQDIYYELAPVIDDLLD